MKPEWPAFSACAAMRADPATRMRVVVVDDNVDAAETLATVLQLSGYDVRTAHTAEAALALVSHWRPEAALLDIGLPDASGNDLARRLRSEAWGPDMLLVAVTGWAQDEDRGRTSSAGFDAHMVKPVDPQQVVEAFAAQRKRSEPAARAATE